MGCDIHLVLERKWEDKWIGINDFSREAKLAIGLHANQKELGDYDVRKHWRAEDRNYEFFGQLAGVRRGGPFEPKGLPDDVSDLTRMHVLELAGDGHSHSWHTAAEFVMCWIRAKGEEAVAEAVADRITDNKVKYYDKAVLDLLGLDVSYGLDAYRVVFWFDN